MGAQYFPWVLELRSTHGTYAEVLLPEVEGSSSSCKGELDVTLAAISLEQPGLALSAATGSSSSLAAVLTLVMVLVALLLLSAAGITKNFVNFGNFFFKNVFLFSSSFFQHRLGSFASLL